MMSLSTSTPPTNGELSVFRDRLGAFIRKRVSNTDDADDILQDVLVKIYKGASDVRQTGRVEAWSFQIARNAIIDHYRASRRGVEAVSLEDRFDPSEELDTEEAHREVAECIRPMIEMLPETYRDALLLAELDGLTQREVADRLGISLSGAKSRVQRGRAKLREVLLQCCIFEIDRCGTVRDFAPRPSGINPC